MSASTRSPPLAAMIALAASSPKVKGWQHTFLSCMRRLLSLVNSWPPTLACSSAASAMHMPLPSAPFSEVALVDASLPNKPFSPSSRVLYHCLCASERGTLTTVSVFGGRSLASTAALVRRSMRGCRRARAAATALSSPKAASASTSIFSAPAASSTSWKSTETSARSSWRLFWRGVPVSRRLAVVRIRRTACETRELSFLTL
mmetsp:Transcript_6068/g.27203  ORF Transcript_6068/g.27203 Transcript_6068/m.27203 type:complete len:203 (+) Transcript_6068:1505-2113(+)